MTSVVRPSHHGSGRCPALAKRHLYYRLLEEVARRCHKTQQRLTRMPVCDNAGFCRTPERIYREVSNLLGFWQSQSSVCIISI